VTVFIAWPGAATDARHHVADALAQGAPPASSSILAFEAFGLDDGRVASYPQLKAASGPIAVTILPSQQSAWRSWL
jgi:UDP-N-acetylmuramoyl-L-alanyl-D-glutamate--2,6-diaminopimelate ligase